ncbi:hypothetical protein, partial [Rhodopseudomonas sp. BR0M22]|uniref:hypothetical protein n=1 Tax=Rhodopseudomonas sp. BR0M22 TaxID=2269369 RepID=UPI001967195D
PESFLTSLRIEARRWWGLGRERRHGESVSDKRRGQSPAMRNAGGVASANASGSIRFHCREAGAQRSLPAGLG